MKKAQCLAGIAALALAAAGLLVPAAASAATTTPGSAAAATSAPASASGSGTVTGTIPGTLALCTSYWSWHVSYPPSGGYSEVEWTSNPCGFKIEDRSWCESLIQPGSEHWNYSGIVKRTYLWDQAGCGITEEISWAQERFYDGSSWSGWNQYWTR
jgi:hypothetical protein